jgi:hypothetical protein
MRKKLELNAKSHLKVVGISAHSNAAMSGTVRTDGTWVTTRGNELRVDYQINDQPAVRLPWTASADGKTASYKGDAVGLCNRYQKERN